MDPKNWHSETSETCGVLKKPGMTNGTLKKWAKKKERGQKTCASLQEVSPSSSRCTVSTSRALIDLRLLNFALIKEWSCSAPFFFWFWLYLFGFGLDAAGLNVSMVRCPRWMSGALASVYFCSDKFFLFRVEIWEVTAQWGSHQRQCVTEQSNKGGVKLKLNKLACNVQCMEEMLLVGYLHQQIRHRNAPQ